MSRWVRIDCNLFNHHVFSECELTEREAWVWLIMHAAWRDTRHRIGAEILPVPRGSMFVTLRELQAAWRWKSDYRVRCFLEMLENEAMLKRDGNAKKTLITICNYERFQSADDDSERKENADKTQEKRNENALKIPIHQEYQDSSLRSESISRDPENDLISEGVSKDQVRDWKAVRKAKRAGPITQTVVDALRREAGKAGVSVPDAVRTCIERGWQGFRAEYLKSSAWQTGPPIAVRPAQQILDRIHQLEGQSSWEPF